MENEKDRRCALIMTGSKDTANWPVIWEIGVWLTDACVRRGKRGRENSIGMLNSKMKVRDI